MARTSLIYDHCIICPSSVTLTFNQLEKMYQTALFFSKDNNCSKCRSYDPIKSGRTDACTQAHTTKKNFNSCVSLTAGPRSAVGRAPDSYVRGPWFDTRLDHILSFLLPLNQEGQLPVTGESMCTKYWSTA